MTMNFSQLNLQYLIQARDLTRQDPRLAEVLIGIPDEMACLLSDLSPHQLTQIIHIKSPLLIHCQKTWWWSRLFTALHDERPDEIEAIIDHASLIVLSRRDRV